MKKHDGPEMGMRANKVVKKHPGFLLLEACIGLLLVGLFGCIVSAWYIQIIRVEQEIVQRVQTVVSTQSQAEEVKAFGTILPRV